ncbi:MAG: GAF and ANTAR domain-containing protein [Sporichthyaceae bacterium]
MVHHADSDGPSEIVDPDTIPVALDEIDHPPAPSGFDRVAQAVAARAQELGVEVNGSLLCGTALVQLGVSAAAVSVPGGLVSAQTVAVAGDRARELEELQVTLGEGPSRDGLLHGSAVMVDDLTAPEQQTRWPLYAASAVDRGMLAQYVLPMQVGAARLGVFVLYADHRGALDAAAWGEARIFAGLALEWLLDTVTAGVDTGGDPDRRRQGFLDDRPEIHQATGMVSIQLGVDLGTALLRLRARAFAEDRLLSDLSADIVARRIRFRPDDGLATQGGNYDEETS